MPSSFQTRGSSLFSWGIALAATSLLTVGGGSLIWNHRSAQSTETAVNEHLGEPTPFPAINFEFPPVRGDKQLAGPGLHTIAYGVENGTAIVKIRVVPDGDELIVDASTGRLLETRPSRPTAPPPMGKFAAPFTPMM